MSKLVGEIRQLESIGIRVGEDDFIEGISLCVAGNYLGSHMLCGFVENVNATYFCRYCSITKADFQETDGSAKGCRRTI